MDMDYLQLPPLNTTHGMFGEEATEKALARGRTLSAKRKLLPSIRTSMSMTPANRLQIPQIPQLSPRSAAAALADALGISPSDLEPPTRATEEQRIVRRTSSIYTTTPEHNADIMTPIDYMIEQRLKSAVADTLGLPLSSIPRDESFQDLGGDTRAARLLRARCQQVGLSVKTRDILDCRTLAELETRITPMHRSPFREPSCTISPLKLSSAANSPKATRASSQQRPLPDLAAFNSKPILQPKASKRYHNRVEQVLSLNSDVSRACVIKPKAGMFEGQTVAFLSLASCVIQGPNDCDLKLLNAYYTTPLPSIRAAVKAKVDELLVPSVWVVLERLPLDDNGVINRRKMQTWIQNANEELHRQIMSVETQELLVAPTTDIEAQLQRLVGTVLHMDTESISMNQSFAKLGGDSKTAMQLVVRSKSQGLSLKVEDVLQTMSLTQLAALAVVSGEMPRRSLEATGKETELSPMQRLYFHTVMGNKSLLRSSRNGTYRFNQSLLLRINKSIGIEDVHAAVEAVVAHHAMLRTRFRRSGASWSQHTLSEVPSSYHFGHHAVCTNEEMQTVIKNAQINIDIENGPVFAAHHFHTNDGYQVLYLVAHHLVIDSKSWHIITQDLEELLLNGTLATNHVVSYQGWSSHQRRRISSMENPAKLPFTISPANCEYWGVQSSRNTYGSTVSYSFTLGSDVTSLLEESNHAFRTKSSDIFMAALLQSFSKTFTDRATPTIWSQENDRAALDSELDITQTVGWFTSLSPLSLSVGQAEDMSRVLSRVKDSRLDVAERGVSYFASQLRHAASAEAFASSTCPMEIIFTYAGPAPVSERQDHLLEQLPIPTKSLVSDASDIGANVGRIALFEVSASVEYGELKFKFVCNKDSSRQDLIQLWVRSCESHLRQTVHRLHIQVPELTRADMPFIEIEYDGIAKMNRDVLPQLNVEVSNIECIYPVTPNQQNLLVNEALVSGTSIMQSIYTLDTIGGYVDVGRICAAWQGIIEKHPALRTVFSDSVSNNGLYDQIILRRHSPNMLFIESFLADEAMESVEKLSPPALIKGTPWHRLVVCQAPGKTLLKLEISQAICDSTSLIKIFNELDRAYFHHETPTTTTVSYPEYLQCLKTTPVSTEFWRELLTDVPSCQFPTLVSRTVSPKDYFTDSIALDISPQNLADFAGKYEIEVTTVLRVAWGLVLRAYVGNDTVCFGYRTSGRDIPAKGLSDAVGCFSNILACRFHLHPSQAMDELLLISDENHHESLHHQHVSVNKMQRALGAKSGRLFNTCLSFGYENTLNSKPGSRVYHIKTTQHSEYDLNVDVNFRNGGLSVDLGHRILNSEQAGHVAHAFGKAIESLMHAPNSMVKEMNLFNDHDQEQVLRWNGRSKSPEKIKNHIHRLIAEHALENSDIQAVCAWDGDLTYGELDELSMTVASHLRNRGVTADSPVPVIVDKSRWAIVAMLGVLNSGGILVPVDAELPSMFGWVTKSVGAQIVLASESVRSHLEGVVSCDVVYLNEETVDSMAFQDVAVEPPNTKSHQTACILFEHQGAEQHKGIKYTHGALSTAFISQGPALRINPSSRVMQVSSFSTDVALSEVFTTLINGGCICVPSAAERLSNFTSAACRMQVNWSYLTPTLSRSLRPEALPDMAIVCFRTLNLDEDTYAPWADRAKVLLAYGSAVSCPLGLSASEIKDTNSLRCIGKPAVGNFWVVSPSKLNRLVPIGAVGVLVIESPTLAEGYETAEKDVMRWNPAAKQPGRLLRTGHFVRYKEDGQLELVAGQGDMTSIEGKTFLKSEVEPHLRKCLGRGVDVFVETIAFNYHDSDSKPILAAFIQMGGEELFGEGGEELNRLSLHTKEKLYLAKRTAEMSLRDTLPRHMIPSTFIPVRKIPLTSSLEVNRLGLSRLIAGFSKTQLLSLASVPNPREVQAAGLHPLPLTRVEERVRSLWASVLGIEDESSITAEDGFVRLGGNHDLAHELVVVARRQGISISVVDILRNTSLTEICRGIALPALAPPPPPSSNANISIGSNSPRISNNSNSTAPTSPSHSSIGESIAPQLGCDRDAIEDVTEASSLQNMFVESSMHSGGETNGSNNKGAAIDWFAIHVQNNGSLDWGKLEHACNLVTLAHPILRTTFATHDRRLWQVVLRHPIPGQNRGGPSQHQLVEFDRYQCPSWRLSTVAGKLIKRDQGSPVDFRKPVTKFVYLDGGKNAILLLRLSRAQYNDLSLPVLIKDLSRLYEQGELTTKSAGFCDVMRAAKQASKNGAVDYWRALLRDSQMPQVVAHTGPKMTSVEPKTLRQQIPTGSLQNLGIPFETVLKGAWALVLAKLAGPDDVVFGHLVEGKHLHLENVLGPCGGIVPVRAKIPAAPVTPYDYFRHLQSQHVASIPYENMQFVDILQKCTPWPAWTRFSTVVQHQAQTTLQNSEREFAMGNAACRLSSMVSPHAYGADLFVKSVPVAGEGGAAPRNMDISLMFCEKRIHPFFAEEVLKMLCSTIGLLTSAFVMEPLVLKSLNEDTITSNNNNNNTIEGAAVGALRIPLSPIRSEASGAAAFPAPVQAVLPDHASAIHAVISAGWESVLGAAALARVRDVRSVPFYDVWGSLIPAAELARFYNESMPKLGVPGLGEHTIFTLEDIVEAPTMMLQYEMIIAKQQQRRDSHHHQHSRGHSRNLSGSRRSPSVVVRANAWGKNLKKLTTSAVGGSANVPVPQTIPEQSKLAPTTPTHARNRSHGSSMESMTTGSSQSDEDEMMSPTQTTSPQRLARRRSVFNRDREGGSRNSEGLGKKKSTQFLGKFGVI